LLAFGRMTISQQREAFLQLTQARGLEIDAEDAATFVEQLETGDHDDVAAQARNFLQNHEDFFDFFDLRNIQTAREQGAKLVIAGSEFYANAVKDLLSKQFPGIEKGWEAVEDLENKLQRLLNPEVKASDVAALLRELGYDVTDEEAESFVQTIGYSIELLKAQAGREPATEPTSIPAVADGDWAVYNTAPIEALRHSAIGILVAEVDKVNAIQVCTLIGGGLCEGENAKTTLAEAGGVTMVLGPFETYDDAVRAFCDNIVPGTVKQAAIIGTIADFKFDGTWHAIYNAPGCDS
jgi:ribosomal protein L12E/L44/L45/RPP1/RPP2